MTTQPQGVPRYEVKVFGYGAPDIGFSGPQFYPFIAHCFPAQSPEKGIEQANRFMGNATRAWAEQSHSEASEWVGAAVYADNHLIWSNGRVYTLEEIEQA